MMSFTLAVLVLSNVSVNEELDIRTTQNNAVSMLSGFYQGRIRTQDISHLPNVKAVGEAAS